MGKVKVAAFSLSLDGYGAGPDQSQTHPLGVGADGLHKWILGTRTFQAMTGGEGGSTGVDDAFTRRSFKNVGAWIMGRNMFGPVRGPWPDASWRGWWGEEPPYHVPVFVLTHHPRTPLEMEGGTTFHFVTGGPDEAMQRAREAAGERDVRIGGGVQTVRAYLQRGMIDEMHLVTSPVVLGQGEALFAGIDLVAAGFRCVEHVASPEALHSVLVRTGTD
ncbi:dihydrofolate reductase family protein [Chiayiivirga flava]|uniref:Dihydrofolate reductase n=1 Tax=Chiayiivirga flava TaxID=659595 RepID=A0A7W8D509_9GAMM|nr:dihydrofolate reductase family protein [Chiayiivirga flava]MBB5208046.1 dihydrofolate reductase [Chiayiivirga flava]